MLGGAAAERELGEMQDALTDARELLTTVEHSPEAAWFAWLFKRDQWLALLSRKEKSK